MQLVAIIPQAKVGIEETLTVSGVAAMNPPKPVQERTLPPLLTYAHEQPVQTINETKLPVQRQVTRQAERRSVCRRVSHRSILEEIRSSIDRRKHQQRGTDLKLHIDEEA